MPANEYAYISSSLVKEVASLGQDVSKFVPQHVQQALKQK
jgi:pantetheine-phosphate adenylyltransferase